MLRHLEPAALIRTLAGYTRSVDETFSHQRWPVLQKDDAGLTSELMKLLTARTSGNPYAANGIFAANIALLPPGLRAMAATHWLDISLTLDSLTWHFGNFGEPQLVAETEAGLRELGLAELASCFVEAKELMLPLLAQRTELTKFLSERGSELALTNWTGELGPLTTLGRANLSSTRHGFDIRANIQSEFSGPSNPECGTSWEVPAY